MKRRYGTQECSIDGCSSKHKAQGYCDKHYQRLKIYGNPLMVKHEPIRGTVAERLWGRVNKTETCWHWTGHIIHNGYGIMRVGDNGTVLVHRVSYELTYGTIPEGTEVHHECHTRACKLVETCPHRSCVNPQHLFAISHVENTRRGNAGWASKGSKHKKPKTHCKRGHAFSPENTKVSPTTGERICTICRRQNDQNRRTKLREVRIATGEVITKGPKPKTHCKNGHLFSEKNTYIWGPDKMRRCRICHAARVERYKQKKARQ